jgi:hypothetical protein
MDMYEKVKSETEARNQQLETTLGVSEKFWDDLNGLLATLKDLQDTLAFHEPPALEPRAIKEQQEALEVTLTASLRVDSGSLLGGHIQPLSISERM